MGVGDFPAKEILKDGVGSLDYFERQNPIFQQNYRCLIYIIEIILEGEKNKIIKKNTA